MNPEQIIRIDKTFNEPLYLLDIKTESSKLTYKISGSTNNIYNIQIYTASRHIYCNCPDSKKWAKFHNVKCKHCCFVLLKIFKISNHETFFETNTLSQENINEIKTKHATLNINQNNEFINTEYCELFKKMNEKKEKKIILRENHDTFCSICYDEHTEIQNIKINTQCKKCLVILHTDCLKKWLNHGNTTCPFCRTQINTQTGYYKNLFD
jgi:hypothetical protein